MGLTATETLDRVIPLSSADVIKAGYSSGHETEDHFIVRNGKEFAGTHVLQRFFESGQMNISRHLRGIVHK